MHSLEQSSSLRPLPRVLVLFACVTGLAGDHKVTLVVSGDTRPDHTLYRERMIDLIRIFPFAKFTLAVVATPLLASVLILYILRGMSPWDGFLEHVAVAHVGIMFFQMRQAVQVVDIVAFLLIPLVRQSTQVQYMFCMIFVPDSVVLSELLRIGLSLRSTPLICAVPILLVCFVATLYAPALQFINSIFVELEVLSRSWQHSFTLRTPFFSLGTLCSLFAEVRTVAMTFFATRFQYTVRLMKVCRSSGEYVQTSRTPFLTFLAFWYLNPKGATVAFAFLASAIPSVLRQRIFVEVGRGGGKTLFTQPTYFRLAKMLQAPFFNPFFTSLLALFLALYVTGITIPSVVSSGDRRSTVFALLLRGILRYDIAHDRSNLSVVTSWVVPPTPGLNIISSDYTMKQPQKQGQEVFAW
jgi:hypothetical protein